MSDMSVNNLSLKKQNGATLIVALVLLAVVTVLGLTGIRSSNLELKMAASARDRVSAQQNAEAALGVVTQMLDLKTNATFDRTRTLENDRSWPNINSFLSTCQEQGIRVTVGSGKFQNILSKNCFTETCASGLCFTGDISGQKKSLCSLKDPTLAGDPAINEMWRKESIWRDNSGLHGLVKVPNSKKDVTEVKYLVEMLCFAERSDKQVQDDSMTDAVPLYRVTVQATGEAKRSTVMAQAVYKGNIR